jgi:uncharacterized metal-binding protein
MSDGKVHSAATFGVAAGVLLGAGISTLIQNEHIPSAIAGCFVQIILSPDLDVDNGFIGNYYMRKIGLNWWYSILMAPYRNGFKHRSKWSHFPIISTILRLIYLLSPIIIILLFPDQPETSKERARLLIMSLFSQLFAIPFIMIAYVLYAYNIDPRHIISFVWSIMVADTLHYIFDEI